jgi:hypothetical protein
MATGPAKIIDNAIMGFMSSRGTDLAKEADAAGE